MLAACTYRIECIPLGQRGKPPQFAERYAKALTSCRPLGRLFALLVLLLTMPQKQFERINTNKNIFS
jgi:hypothetical protein